MSITEKQQQLTIKILIVVAILANSVGILFPVLRSTFAPYYGSIAKHMAESGNWTDLVLSNQAWMDKPHLPFWISAISFKIFGVHSYSYILPGFLAHILGVIYTYKMGKLLYNKNVGLLAALFTASALHLMLSSIDVRAEAYLIGFIMPACYYWYKYDRLTHPKYLLLGAIFTACALMTKGIFVLITIASGFVALWTYKRELHKLRSIKWIAAILLSFVFIAPELIALHCQFDANPHVTVFGHQHISGLRWYFWDSQFGRFLNTGPIKSLSPVPFHYLFFVHVFLWAYLPWWTLFFAAICYMGKHRDERTWYLLGSFFVTFVVFSITTFQVDHYTNIIFPFASIICAAWVDQLFRTHQSTWPPRIFITEMILSLILVAVTYICGALLLTGNSLLIVYAVTITVTVIYVLMLNISWQMSMLIYPTLAISSVFVFIMVTNGMVYAKYDSGYQIAKYLDTVPNGPVIGYDIGSLSLDFHIKRPYILASATPDKKPDSLENNGMQLIIIAKKYYSRHGTFYCVINANDMIVINRIKHTFPSEVTVLANIAGTDFNTYLLHAAHLQQLEPYLTHYLVLQIN